MRAFAKDPEELAKRVSRYLKAQLAESETTYADLTQKLKRHGYPNETIDSLKQKMHRGTFPAGFFLAVLAALDVTTLSLDEI